MSDPNIISPTKEETKPLTNNFTFSLTCPHCQTLLTPNDFDNNHFTIAHLQSYFQQKETEYKQQIRQQLEQEITSLPIFQQLQKENQELKLIVEGYKLGSTKTSKTKGEDLEKYILEQLQASYNGSDEISKITHVGEKADIIHTIHKGEQQLAKIIYEIKNVDKWEPKWLEKLEKDMVKEQADWGIIIATCRNGQPLWKPYPQKNILVSDEDNFIFASQMARLLVMAKRKFSSEESPQERIKKWEEWMKDKLPNYLLRLEKSFTEWEKDITRINTSIKSMEKTREDMKKVVLGEMEGELKAI
jgi:thiol-disulfide isomerase/thioredoxin